MRTPPLEKRKEIGLRIRSARLRKGWTQEELARAINVSWVTVSRWERGEKYPAQHREVIKNVLGVEV